MGRVGNIFFLMMFGSFLFSVSLMADEGNRVSEGEKQISSQQLLVEKKMRLAKLENEWGVANGLTLPQQSGPAEETAENRKTEAPGAVEQRRAREMEELDKLREAQLKMQQERIAAVQKEKARQITAHIDLSRQRMMIYKGDTLLYKWPVSTAKRGYVTPVGVYQPQYLERMHYSRRYHNSPMPHSIFFKGNFAIHGTNSISRLGRRASHGCVRLHPKHARKLYALVRKFGKKNTMIKITY